MYLPYLSRNPISLSLVEGFCFLSHVEGFCSLSLVEGFCFLSHVEGFCMELNRNVEPTQENT